MSGFRLGAILLLAAQSAGALPPYARLFQAKYGYKPNCTACHDRDSWDNNDYGKAFLKAGRNIEAFAKIEPRDHDEDSIPSGEEIHAGANPGDPRSTLKSVGDWLKKLPEIVPPRKHLDALFPGADAFAYREAEIQPEARRRIEKGLGVPLRDEDLYPSYFLAYKEGKKLGAALYGSSSGADPCFFLAGYSGAASGPARLTGLRMLACEERPLRKSAYLDQFAGKAAEELKAVRAPKPALEAASSQIVEALRIESALAEEILK